MNNHYNVDIVEALALHISKESLAFLGLIEDEFHHLNKLMEVSPRFAIMQAYSIIGEEINKIMKTHNVILVSLGKNSLHRQDYFIELVNMLKEDNLLPNNITLNDFEKLEQARNQVAHSSNSSFQNHELKKYLKVQ